MHRSGRTACTIPCNPIKHVCDPDPTSTLFALPSIRSVKNAFHLCVSSQSNKPVALDWDGLSLILPAFSFTLKSTAVKQTNNNSFHSLASFFVNQLAHICKIPPFLSTPRQTHLFHDLSYKPFSKTSRFLQHERDHPSKLFAYDSLYLTPCINQTPTRTHTIST